MRFGLFDNDGEVLRPEVNLAWSPVFQRHLLQHDRGFLSSHLGSPQTVIAQFWFSENFDRGGVAGGGCNRLVPGDQRSMQLFGESYVSRVAGTQIMPVSPDPLEQQHGSIACDPKSVQVLNGLSGPLRG
jgi:hypothetical protein